MTLLQRTARFIPLALFLGALASRLWFFISNPELTYGVSVLGVPFSDAAEWEKLAESINSGAGMTGPWMAQRPLYPLILAILYLATGPSVLAAQLLNILVSAATVPLVYMTGRRIAGFAPALAASLILIGGPEYAINSMLVMSETLGLFFSVLATYALVLTAQYRSNLAAFGAGAAFALVNLTRPLTLLAAPLLGAGCVLCMIFSRRGRGDALRLFLLFALGAGLLIGPWLIRQYRVHGIIAITNKSAESLYAASSKRVGAWNAAIDEEAFQRDIGFGIKERYDYFMAQTRANLRSDPWWYAAHVGDGLRRLLAGPAAEERPVALMLLLTALALVAAPLSGLSWRAGAAAVFTALLLTLPVIAAIESFGWLTAPIGAVLALAHGARRRAAAAGLLLLISAGLGLALVYETQNLRFLLLIDWLLLLYMGAAVAIPARFLAVRIFGGRDEPEIACYPSPALTRRAALAITTLFLIGGMVIAWRTYVRGPAELAVPKLSAEQATQLNPNPAETFLRVLSFDDDNGALGKLVIAPAMIDRHFYTVPAHLQLPFNARIFESRPYDRTVFQIRLGNGEPSYAIIPGRLDSRWSGATAVIVGRLNVDTREVYYDSRRIIEIMRLIPWDPAVQEFNAAAALTSEEPMHWKFLEFLKSKRKVEGPPSLVPKDTGDKPAGP